MDKSRQNGDRFNIIIPTHNRPERLRRLLNYYDEFSENYDINVADSSSDENKKRNKKIISSFSNLNIVYTDDYSPKDDVFLRLPQKLSDTIDSVEKKYCSICSDDDFATPNAINQSIDFLEKNPDYTSVHGDYISFYLKEDENKQKQVCWRKPTYKESITFPDAESRLLFHLSNYFPTTIAVHRTDSLNMAYKETMKYTNDLRFYELSASMLTLIHGKMKVLDMFHIARETSPDSLGMTGPTLGNFVEDGTYDRKYSRFKECLAFHLTNQSKLNKKEAKRVVDKGWAEYTKCKKGFLASKMSCMMKNMSLPHIVDEGARKIYRKSLHRSKHQSQKDVPNYEPPKEYLNDLNHIKKYILPHSKKN